MRLERFHDRPGCSETHDPDGAIRSGARERLDQARRSLTRDGAMSAAQLLPREAQARVPFRPDHLRTASLIVLKAPDVPSVLLEAGYITNDTDLAFITSASGRDAIAASIADAVGIHFARRLAGRVSVEDEGSWIANCR